MPRGPDREHLKISPFDNCLRHSFLSTHSNNIVTSASCENWSYGICGQCNSRPACAVWSVAMLSVIKKKARKVSWHLLSILLSMHFLTRLCGHAGWTVATLATYCISPIFCMTRVFTNLVAL